MFHCYIHNWSNHRWICPECVQTATTASNASTDALIGVNLSHYRALESKLTKAESDLKVAKEALAFYADRNNWICSETAPRSMYQAEYLEIKDGEEEIINTRNKRLLGGKRARQALKQINEKG